MLKFLKRLRRDESGASMVEYALLAALVSIAAIVMITNVGGQVNTTFSKVNDKLVAANK